jgi:hypothetical protein
VFRDDAGVAMAVYLALGDSISIDDYTGGAVAEPRRSSRASSAPNSSASRATATPHTASLPTSLEHRG